MTDITGIVEIAISLLATIITALVIPLFINKYGQSKIDTVAYWVRIAVSAAEQIYKSTVKSGTAKKNYVLEFLQKNNITYNSTKIDAMIESAVLALQTETINTSKTEASENVEIQETDGE